MSRPWSVNKKRRTEAAEACYQMASSSDRDFPECPANRIEAHVIGKPPVIALAKAAFDAISTLDIMPYDNVREWWAEAGRLIEDGWTPGDEILLMKDIKQAEYDRQIEAQHDAMNAAGVPADAENLASTDEEKPVANDDMTAAHEDFDIQATTFEDEDPADTAEAEQFANESVPVEAPTDEYGQS